MKKFTPEKLIEILVEKPKGFLDQEQVKIPEKLVYVLEAERYMAKVYLHDGVPTVEYNLRHSDRAVIMPLQLVDSRVVFEEFVTCEK